MKEVIANATGVLLLLTTGCAPSVPFDDARYQRLLEYSRSYRHVVVSEGGAFRNKVLGEIGKGGERDRVLVAYDAEFSLLVEREEETGTWTPRAFLRMRAPDKTEFSEGLDFLRACADYHVSVWVLAHPAKPYYFCPAVPIVELRPGVWGVETGPAVVAGRGLVVEVDSSGRLVSLKEIHNPE